MTLEQLRIFVAVAEREHVTRAARDLNLTQSATSAAVAALQARFDVRLFDRVGRRIALTDAGRLFLVEARAVLARAAAAEAVLADLAGLRRGTLGLAASQTVANYWLPRFIHRFRADFPGIAVDLTIGNTEAVTARVEAGESQLGFIEGEVEAPMLVRDPVAEDELVLVVAPGHPWAARPPGSARDLKAGRWVLRERGSGTRAMFEATLPGLGLAPEDLVVAQELPANEAVRAAVEAGAGASVLSRLVVASALAVGTLVAVDLKLPGRRFYVLRHRERYVTTAAREFLRLVTDAAPDGPGE